VVEENKVPILIWGSAPHLTLNNEYVFRDYPSDTFQGKFAAEYMFKEGKRKAAVIYVQNDWGIGMKDVFVKKFKELGGEVVLEEGVAQDAIDLRGAITKMSNKNPDVLFFPVYPNLAVVGLKQMHELNANVPVYSGDVMETTDVIKSGYAEGVKYTIGKIVNPTDFAEKVNKETGKTSEFATPLGYDSLYVLADVIGKVGTDHEAIKNELYFYKKTDGVSVPTIEFDENGDLKNAILGMKVIENEETKDLN
jgi:branched-chain amino acid transport system substrate-binding protein